MSCSPKGEEEYFSKELGISLSGGTIAENTDTHDGSLGDGYSYMKVTFSKEEAGTIAKEIKIVTEEEKKWHNLPLSENVKTLVYGQDTQAESVGPYVTDEDGNALFPAVEKGYYFFYDRSDESKNPQSDSDVLKRSSFNFTVAVYDEENQTLYIYALDT